MPRWVSLDPDWKLQDVQAGLNVVLTALFAGAIFSLVRWHWLLAAQRVLHHQHVPAYLLLSLNTVGEAIDVVLLLRKDLFSLRFAGLLIQTICVVLLTIAAIFSGFIARFCTRNNNIVQPQVVQGLLSERAVESAQFSSAPTNATLLTLARANFPTTQLPEFLPGLDADWTFEPAEWNSSWALDCAFEHNVPIDNPETTGNCSTVLDEVPLIRENWQDWNSNSSWWYDYTGWRNDLAQFRDILIFSHGIAYGNGTNETMTRGQLRTVATHLTGVPYNVTSEDVCVFGKGKVTSAIYSSFTCNMTRELGNRSNEELHWGANPDAFDLETELTAHLDYYGYNLRQTSQAREDYELMSGEELLMFYQAYLLTKDTSRSARKAREISVRVLVAEISLNTLIICPILAALILSSVGYYWFFLWRNRHRLDQIPQSKLDWMIQTLKKETQGNQDLRKKLRTMDLSGSTDEGGIPLVGRSKSDPSSVRKGGTQRPFEVAESSRDTDSFVTRVEETSPEPESPKSTRLAQRYSRLSS